MRAFFLILLITLITATPVSIGSCEKYSSDGQSCELCIANYHLYDGACYVDILGCADYQFGNICHQCQKNYILVNNMCCDMVCMSKIFSKFKKQVKQQVIANNTQILASLIPFAQTQYLTNSSGRLVAIQVKEYQQAKRFFLLYEFYQSQFYSKRLVVDYLMKSKRYIIVDWTVVSNSWRYSTIEWVEVDDDLSLLLLFPGLYPAGQRYSQVVARKAVLSQIPQYQLATLIDHSMLIRTLYDNKGQIVILKQSESVPIIAATGSQSTAQNTTQDNTTTSSNTTTPTQNNTSTSANTSQTNTTSQAPSSGYHGYELRYQGNDILAELDANQPLIGCFNLIKLDVKWNHSLSLIVESGKIPDVIEFLFIGENNHTGSVIKYSLNYNVPTHEPFIISVSQQLFQIQQQVIVQPSNTTTPVISSSPNTTDTSNSTVGMTQNKVFIVEEGCSTHTFYISPLAPQIQSIANKLQLLRQQALQSITNSSTPIIASPGLSLRRLVVSQNCEGSSYREIAFVEGDGETTKQFFTYYFEVNDPEKQWYYLGVQNKTQSTTVFTNPYIYPIYVSDPSFLTYPSASLFYQSGIRSLYSGNLSTSDDLTFRSLTGISTSEKDRNMGKMSRFAIDGVNTFNERYRMTGWRVNQPIEGLDSGDMISLICSEGMITESLTIGNSDWVQKYPINVPNLNNSTSPLTLPTFSEIITTTISTSILGDQTVETTNVAAFLNEDSILQDMMPWLLNLKPIIMNYYIASIQISEYNQALEYHLLMNENNVKGLVDFISSNMIKVVIVYDKTSDENVLLSFEVVELNNSGVIINIGETNINIDEYVVVEIKTPIQTNQTEESVNPAGNNTANDTQNGTINNAGTNTTNNTGSHPITNTTNNETTPPKDNATTQHTTTQNTTTQNTENATTTPSNTTASEPTSPTSSSNTTTTTQPSTTTTNTTGPSPTQLQKQLSEIERQQRIQQVLDTLLQQLHVSYGIASPTIIQALQQLNQLEHVIKLTLLVQDAFTKTNYSVIAIANLDTQTDPIIESVKPITQQTVDKLIKVQQPITTGETKPITCEKKTLNTQGQEVCMEETTSPQVDIVPGQQTTSHETQNDTSTSVNNTTNTINTTISHNNATNTTIPTVIVTEHPSDYVLQIVEQKSFQQTTQSIDGQIRKLYVNPTVQTLTEEIKHVIQLVRQQQTQLQKQQSISEQSNITVKSIQLAATTIYVHYAITIRIVYTLTVVIRRYYVVYPVNSTLPLQMGHQDLPLGFDFTVKENRAFTDLVLLALNTNQQQCQNAVNLLNSQYKTTFIVQNIVYYYYRVFPLGEYGKVTIKNDSVVGNIHLVSSNDQQTNSLINWHYAPIEEIIHSVQTNNSSPITNATSSNTTNTSNFTNGTDHSTLTNTTIPDTTSNTTTHETTNNTTQQTTNTTQQATNNTQPSQNHTNPASTSNTTTPTANNTDNTTTPQANNNTATPITNTTATPTNPTNNTSPTNTTTPQQLINQQQVTTSSNVVISLSMQQKLAQVLKYLSVEKGSQLEGGSLQQYAATEDKSSDGTVNAVQFDFYFLKFVSDQLLRQFICSAIRHQSDGTIDIALFLSNDINLGEGNTDATETTTDGTVPTTNEQIQSNTTHQSTSNTTSQTKTIVQTQVKQEQVEMNSDLVLVDPNQFYYPEAIQLIEQDPLKVEFEEIIDLNALPSYVQQIIKFLRAKYSIIDNAGGLRIVRSLKSTNIIKFRIYLFKQLPNNYEIYRCVLEYNTETPQTKYNVISFQLYASNHQLSTSPRLRDESLDEDTDIAYGYVVVDLSTLEQNSNVQNILRHLNNMYRAIIASKNVVKIEELKLLDGRINYKLLYRDPLTLSEFKFIIFYQPQLQKVLVLNSVNLPHHSQYNQLTSEQQKTDSLLPSVLSYLNNIHPEIQPFELRSVSKATETTFSEYQLVVQSKNKKFKSLIRVASNNVDLTEIDFSQLLQISLDHYKLDQFDQMFIMNYQKISQDQLRTNSKLRMVLSFLYNSHKIDTNASFLGAAFKPFGLGFLYKAFFKIGLAQDLTAAEVYIEAYSDKISLKSIKKIQFEQNLLTITAEPQIMSKIIALIKQKTTYTDFTVQTVSAKDFLYGTLYKFTIATKNSNFDIFVYHDHSTEQIIPLYVKENQSQDQCHYQLTTCVSCNSTNFRVQNNKCIQNVQKCLTYQTNSELCANCDENSQLINGICILKSNCGALCQVISI